ncbi:MAG: Flp family type IVb pilin [Phycisphaerae bacterium]|nr:Flp family type IVb pilin [Phycisphaerae bacterium]
MKTLVKKMRSFLRSEDGPTVTEYAVMLALVIVVCIAGITLIGSKVKSIFTTISGGLPPGS